MLQRRSQTSECTRPRLPSVSVIYSAASSPYSPISSFSRPSRLSFIHPLIIASIVAAAIVMGITVSTTINIAPTVTPNMTIATGIIELHDSRTPGFVVHSGDMRPKLVIIWYVFSLLPLSSQTAGLDTVLIVNPVRHVTYRRVPYKLF